MIFLFDENYSPKIAQGLKILESGNAKSPIPVDVNHVLDFLERGSPDGEVIKLAGQKKAIIFTKDKDFKNIKLQYHLLKEYKVGVAYFRQYKKGLSYWENVKALIDYWEVLKQKLNEETIPFVYEINLAGISVRSF